MKRYIVFIKQVPASTRVSIDPVTHALVRAGAKSRINPYDLHAVRAAVELRERLGGEVVAVTMGPPQAEAALREAMTAGADRAVLLSDRAFAGSDTWGTGAVLAAAVPKIGGGDVLLFGKQAVDGDTAQVGPGVAARLGLPQVTELLRFDEIRDGQLTVEKCCDNGTQQVRVSMPCVLTVTKEANEVPAPTLRQWERAQGLPLEMWGIGDLDLQPSDTGFAGSPTRVVATEAAATKGRAKILGSAEELANLIRTLS